MAHTRWAALAFLFLTPAVLANDFQRERYQQVIKKNFPGFRILDIADFGADVRYAVRDGTSGALLVGHFDYDRHVDFAALVIGSEKKRYQGGNNYSYDYFDGKEVICHGRNDPAVFECKISSEMPITLPQWWYIERIPPGAHSCLEDEGERVYRWKTITIEIDSVGSVFPEKASGFSGKYRDGTKFDCATSD